ncbi:uncharacterized protein LOC106177207 [Lingula anatina]|uniref:Innexin n=1 Tax=Lingula anatina TaxID=7574 RepID=A0A1S3JYJ8_LINAN|nr:uncharacterized protein LOC106177207 [Lingula anatina]|eukprot:XP_013415367.1 uncharacterized protein LOC106177207 [Lingula anatina]
MAPFIDILGRAWKGLRCDDDFYDRLSHRYTSIILLVFTVLVSTKQYVGDPIVCWVPAVFTGAHEDYANNICWISNTYYMPFEERIPGAELPRAHIGYYQWVPIMLLLQSLLFYIPTIVWRLMSGSTGIDVHMIVNALGGVDNLNPENREKVIKFLVRHMDRYFDSNREYEKGCCTSIKQMLAKYCCLFVGKRYGNFLVFLFLFCKLLYMANAIGQFFLLNTFLGTQYHIYGFDVIDDMANNRDWTSHGRFPRVTLCDFKVRQLGGNIHRHTVQCTLPINLFNEKIYMFIWFWLVLVAGATVFGFFTWMSLLFVRERNHFVRKNLKLMQKIATNSETKMTKAFNTKYLKQDGVFILKLIGRNTSDVVVAEVVAELWDHFIKNKPQFHPKDTEVMQPEEIQGMAPFVDILAGVWKGITSDDDYYDRLNHRYTALLLVVFGVLIGSKQYVGDPIVCWVPGVFTGSHKEYANQYCWIKNTYFMPFEERIPGPSLPRAHIGYYQWVTLMLFLQALLFYFPRIFWRLMSSAGGIDFNMIVGALWGPACLDPEKREGTVKTVALHVDRFLMLKQDYSKSKLVRIKEKIVNLICPFIGKEYGNYMYYLYLWVKVFYVCNVLGQLFLLNAFLGTFFHLYGFQVIQDLVSKQEWFESGRFPRVTLCDFKVRQLGGNIHRHTVQCALPINLFNEKIYMFLWFWLVYVCAATIWGLISWLGFLSRRERKSFVAKYLKRLGIINSTRTGDGKNVRKFITKYLRPDGAFILNLCSRNTNDIVIGELIAELWAKFMKDRVHLYSDRSLLDAEGEPPAEPVGNDNDNENEKPEKPLMS